MINKTPKVGRFLFRESSLRDGFFQKAGTITRISGKRIYYNCHKESAIPDERYIHVRTLTAVCDTAAEVDTLTAFNRRVLDEIYALKAAHEAEAKGFFSA